MARSYFRNKERKEIDNSMEKAIDINVAIPQTEQDMIATWINHEGALYSGVKRDPAPLDHVLRFWAKNKARFYRAFGEKLIISRPLDYVAPVKDLRNKCVSEADVDTTIFMRTMSEIFRGTYDSEHPADYKFDGDVHNPVYDALQKVGLRPYMFYVNDMWDMLIDNKWEFCDVHVPMDNGKFFTFKTGMRVTRIFQKVADMFHIPHFNKLRELHAKVSTAKTVHSHMYLSIHPLDYMTMSDNEEGWDSCMNWRDNGDYRAGTVEMLNSPMVVEAYMASEKNHLEINGEKWNSKIWRELYIVTDEFISNIRAYPFIDSNLSKFVVEWLKDIMEQAGEGAYNPTMREYGADFDDDWFEQNRLNLIIETNNMYNDYCRENQWVYLGVDFVEKYHNNDFALNYSGPMVCMNCGELLDYGLDETRMVMCGACSDCHEDYWVCDSCGNEMYDEDDVYEVDGMTLCRSCFEDGDNVVECYDDQEYHWIDNTTEVYLGSPVHNTRIYVYNLHYWLTHENFDHITREKMKYVYRKGTNSYWSSKYFMIPIEYVTDDMLAAADMWDRDNFRKQCTAEDVESDLYPEAAWPEAI